mmetsp:Transcript_106673/g.299707  ORF Transcript_106673/g.299707 Transcript_106673/m.299707 type:complete len:204 (-) Transcript_106673:2802-3413(-)
MRHEEAAVLDETVLRWIHQTVRRRDLFSLALAALDHLAAQDDKDNAHVPETVGVRVRVLMRDAGVGANVRSTAVRASLADTGVETMVDHLIRELWPRAVERGFNTRSLLRHFRQELPQRLGLHHLPDALDCDEVLGHRVEEKPADQVVVCLRWDGTRSQHVRRTVKDFAARRGPHGVHGLLSRHNHRDRLVVDIRRPSCSVDL